MTTVETINHDALTMRVLDVEQRLRRIETIQRVPRTWPAPTPSRRLATCQPWCEYGDGHPSRWVEDQNCYGPMVRVDMVMMPAQQESHYDEAEGTYVPGPDHLDVYAAKNAAGETHVEVLHEPNEDRCWTGKLTLREAQQLAEALQLVLGQVTA